MLHATPAYIKAVKDENERRIEELDRVRQARRPATTEGSDGALAPERGRRRWMRRRSSPHGCAVSVLSPDDNVTRGQMAAFLNRALFQ